MKLNKAKILYIAIVIFTIAVAIYGIVISNKNDNNIPSSIPEKISLAETEQNIYPTAGSYMIALKNVSEGEYVYPEYITGIELADDSVRNATFYMLQGQNTEENRQKILDRVEDKSTVSFADGSDIPTKELYEYKKTIEGYVGEEHGIESMTMDPKTGKIVVTYYEGSELYKTVKEETDKSEYSNYVVYEEADHSSPITENEAERKQLLSKIRFWLTIILIFSVVVYITFYFLFPVLDKKWKKKYEEMGIPESINKPKKK